MIILKLYNKKTKLLLVFFCFFAILTSCKSDLNTPEVIVIYEGEKAVGVSFSSKLTSSDVKVFLEGNRETPVLGTLTLEDNIYIFKPAIPFSEGHNYLLFNKGNQVSNFSVLVNTNNASTELVAIYPTSDTVPENLLKMYFLFSNPMQEVGSSLDFISVTNNATNEKVDVFLNLETELWNVEHTQLTLWLDPGRIKTDLIPNKKKGLPILKNNEYILKIDSKWKDARGKVLDKSYIKKFHVTDRDHKKPYINYWELVVTKQMLAIHFKESLDGILARETFSIKNSKGNIIEGKYDLINNEQTLKFFPNSIFKKGNYTIIIESRLEDLAGNNLNRLFDNDLNKKIDDDSSELKRLQFKVN